MKPKRNNLSKRDCVRTHPGFLRSCVIAAIACALVIPQIFLTKTQATAAGISAAFETARSDFGYIIMKPGSTKTISITFKNTGTTTWHKEGNERVAINTVAPIARHSAFEDASWSMWYRPAKLAVDQVKPGQSATFKMTLHAPLQQREYIERFSLVGLPEGEIPNGGFSFLILVSNSTSLLPYYRGRVTDSSATTITLKPGQTTTMWIEFENRGRQSWWSGNDPATLETAGPRLHESVLANASWLTPTYPAKISNPDVRTGQKTKIFFSVTAPNSQGTYKETFQLVARRLAPIAGAKKTFVIKVKGSPASKGEVKGQMVMEEPDIRVGITSLNDGVEVRPTTKHVFYTADGKKLLVGNAGELSTITYSQGKYTLTTPRKKIVVSQAIRVAPRNGGVTSIVNYRTYYDTFRGIIEVRFAESTQKLWVINELPFEQYLSGLAEAVQGQHKEYMKSLAVAARSYALWHYFVSTKHKNENYTINSTTDQVYKGYYFELKTPDFVEAVKSTRGIVMTHPSAKFEKNPHSIALGAYSSGTDGHTRNFTDVWGGRPEDWEWLVSVDDPLGIIPNATTRPGNHMVGMSATGALRYAVRQNKTYDWILKHYYTGITLVKFF
jgi:hypothetical protein